MTSKVLRPWLLAAACLGGLVPAARAAIPADPSGVWLVEDQDARIRIEHCQSDAKKICGYLVWSKDGTDGLDEKNPDTGKRSRSLLGHQIILGLEPESDKYVGHIYNAENGKTYDVQVWRTDADHMTLKGCVLKFLCKSQTWTKVTDTVPGEMTAATGAPGGPQPDADFAGTKSATAKAAAPRKKADAKH